MSRLAFLLVSLVLTSPTFFAPRLAEAECKRCGPSNCKEGETCCNKGCGICAPEGGGCILLFCNWGRPSFITAPGVPSVDVFDNAELGSSYVNHELRSPFGEDVTHGVSADVRLQHLAAENTSIALVLGGTQLFDEPTFADEKSGFSAGILARRKAEAINGKLSIAPELAAEYRQGPVLHQSLAPAAIADDGTSTIAAGISLSDDMNAVPALGFARYVHSFADGDTRTFVDAGLGFGTELDFLFWPSNKPNPAGLRIDYRFQQELGAGDLRSHEVSGGIYYFPVQQAGWRYGLDVSSTWQSLGDDLDTRIFKAGARINYYWDANY